MTLEYFKVKLDLYMSIQNDLGSQWAEEVVDNNGETYKSRQIKAKMDEMDHQINAIQTQIDNMRAE